VNIVLFAHTVLNGELKLSSFLRRKKTATTAALEAFGEHCKKPVKLLIFPLNFTLVERVGRR
jgi:hypothetical protein